MVGGERHVVGGGAEHLKCGRGPRRDRTGRCTNVENGTAELQNRSLVDHHRHALRHIECPPVGQLSSLEGRANEVGEICAVTNNPDNRLGTDIRECRLDRVVGRGKRAVTTIRCGLVYVDRVRRRGGVKPEVEGTASLSVAIAVERGARRIDDRGAGCARRLEAHLEAVGAVGPPAVAAVADVGIETGVAGARNGQEVGTGRDIEANERIATEGVVVAGDHRADLLAANDVLSIERDHTVELARDHLSRAGDDRFSGKRSGLVERERVEIHVRTVGREILNQLLDVVVAGEDRFTRQPTSHDGRQIVGMLQIEHVADLMECHLEPGAAIFAGAPVDIRVHDRGSAGDAGNGRR